MRYRIKDASRNHVGGVTRRKYDAETTVNLLAWIQQRLSAPEDLISFEVKVVEQEESSQ